MEYFGVQDWCFVSSILELCLFGVLLSTKLVFCKQYFGELTIWSSIVSSILNFCLFGVQDWCFVSSILEDCLFEVFWSSRLVSCKQYFEILSIWSILENKTGVL